MIHIRTAIDAEMQGTNDVIERLAREGACRIIQAALEAEVAGYIARYETVRDDEGRRLVVRNGSMPERDLLSGLGPLPIRQPRVHDRRPDHKFVSSLLPPYLRRLPTIDALLPALYLKGVSSGGCLDALQALLGDRARGLSASTLVRLKAQWEEEYNEWCKRDLSGKRYVYIWADGIYFNVRLTDERPCLLVLMGARPDGTKELLAVWDGERESKLSWKEVLLDLKARGLAEPPLLAVGDGALGFWSALEETMPACRQQRCWVHKTANVLDKLPKKVQPSAKSLIHDMYRAETRTDALAAFERFRDLYEAKYPRAWECLRKDQDTLFTFYDFPAEQWVHIRSTNPIESTFATVRLRTRRTKGCGSRTATLTMVFKLAREAEKRWRRLRGSIRLAQVLDGVNFVDGVHPDERQNAA